MLDGKFCDRLCGLVVRVLGYRSGGPGSIPGTTRKKSSGATEELLERKEATPVYKTENTAVGIRHANHVAPSIRKKLAITSPTSGGSSVGIVRWRTQTTEFFFFLVSSVKRCNLSELRVFWFLSLGRDAGIIGTDFQIGVQAVLCT
jgi:hypothetical protein